MRGPPRARKSSNSVSSLPPDQGFLTTRHAAWRHHFHRPPPAGSPPRSGLVQLRIVFVYGSIAAGGERSDSDIDLMLIGNVSPMDLAVPLRNARELLGREINPTVYTPAEFAKKRAASDHFLTRVLDKPKLFVRGDNDELEKTAG